jgi:hypothetical protein
MSAVLSWEMNHADRERTPEDAVEVLRGVWSAQGQSEAELEDCFDGQKACKRMAEVGFEDLADPGADLRSAWRATLKRDGKLNPEAGSVRDLVLGSGRQAE